MTIKQFIEKAIEGGWKREDNMIGTVIENLEYDLPVPILQMNTILLDPEAWKAVGKVEGWNRKLAGSNSFIYDDGELRPEWHIKMMEMIDALAEGKSVEEFLETL